jgi:drug/metabolite transporter (DMT)-like permease
MLWSTSWILIKIGLRSDLPPITFAGLRYSLAFLCLIPFVAINPAQRQAFMSIPSPEWWKLGILGVLNYSLTQGAIFMSLAYLPAALLNLILSLSSALIGLAGVMFLNERPVPIQWLGVSLSTVGVGLYFLPASFQQAQIFGLLAAITALLTNVLASLLGRQINRSGKLPALIVTISSMGIGSILMLIIGLLFQGIGKMNWQDWMIIAWLAVVNTALAFTLWNHTLRSLSAIESSIINSLMLPQVAILAYIFLGEVLSYKEIAGLVMVGLGVLMVQLRIENSHGRKSYPQP